MKSASPRDYFLNTQIVVHAGGLGERWFPVTQGKIHKALTEIGKKPRPMIDWTLLPYVLAGAKKFYVTLWHQPQALLEHFKEIEKNSGIKFIPLVEPENKRMGRAGVIKYFLGEEILDKNQPILTINSDDILKINPIELAKFQFGGIEKGFFATDIGSSTEISQFGRIKYDPKTNKVQSFVEKPSFRIGDTELVNTGIFYLDSKLVKHFLEIEESEFPVDLERSKMMQEHIVPIMRAFDLVVLGKTWFVLNTPSDYKKVKDFDFEKFFEITNVERYLGEYEPRQNLNNQ
jgi:NDP-sugar pyrophosphorylase family protein